MLLPEHKEFFVQFANLCKEYRIVSNGKLVIDFMHNHDIAGVYTITEIWLNKNEESAVVRVKCKDGGNHLVYSNGIVA